MKQALDRLLAGIKWGSSPTPDLQAVESGDEKSTSRMYLRPEKAHMLGVQVPVKQTYANGRLLTVQYEVPGADFTTLDKALRVALGPPTPGGEYEDEDGSGVTWDIPGTANVHGLWFREKKTGNGIFAFLNIDEGRIAMFHGISDADLRKRLSDAVFLASQGQLPKDQRKFLRAVADELKFRAQATPQSGTTADGRSGEPSQPNSTAADPDDAYAATFRCTAMGHAVPVAQCFESSSIKIRRRNRTKTYTLYEISQAVEDSNELVADLPTSFEIDAQNSGPFASVILSLTITAKGSEEVIYENSAPPYRWIRVKH